MTELETYPAFKKIPRLNRECIVTEKLDGTNGLIHVSEDGVVRAGSRNRWLTPENDNYGFAKWVQANAEDLAQLGHGFHYGEWWGQGIQRRYGLAEKRFSLFNVVRWDDPASRPACCGVVPLLSRDTDIRRATETALSTLREKGSIAAPGFLTPEGIVVYHSASGYLFKVTLENDEQRKGTQET